MPGPLWRIRTANWILFRVHRELSVVARESAGLNRERSGEIREGCGGARQLSLCRERAVGKARKPK